MAKYTKSAERSAEIEKYRKQLEDGVASIRKTEQFRKFLDYLSVFHSYSFNNTIMIMMQKPDAQQVAGFNAWKKVGRTVRKGEHGIRIWAPEMRNITKEDPDTGEEITKRCLVGFRLVSVFDISQTDGEPLEDGSAFNAPVLMDDVENFETITEAVKSVAAYPVATGKLYGPQGICSFTDKKITISDELSGISYVSVLVHETAHSLLHGPGGCLGTKEMEVEAESVAYIVCKRFGINNDLSSFEYIATWAGNMKDDEFKQRLDAIQKTASNIIVSVEKALETAQNQAA